MIDYLIVGSGLAGISFAETAIINNKKILVIDNNQDNASKIAIGLFNPIILKRFSKVWNSQEQLDYIDIFYKKIEYKLNTKFYYHKPILRKFVSIEEQNNWYYQLDNLNIAPYLVPKLISNKYKGIYAPYHYGEVLKTGYLDTRKFLIEYKKYLCHLNSFFIENFDYNAIIILKNFIKYKNILAKHIIFAEGYGVIANPYFKYLPLPGTKGELLIIKAPDLEIDVIINSSIYILPLGNYLFKVGSTYNWDDKTSTPSDEGKIELLNKLENTLTCNFEIVSHFAGIRPTVKDRKPLIGSHLVYKNFHILNGLGTRGVMLGPSMAKVLYEKIELFKDIDLSIDIKRIKQRIS